jgi:hypothetical protein
MNVFNKTYYKALLLLAVFSLNTVVSFACSFSDLFHGFHHQKTPQASEHKQAGGHHHAEDKAHKHSHDTQSRHGHDSGTSKESKDDCCSGDVIQIQKIEKAVSRSIEAPQAIFLTSFFTAYASVFSSQTEERTLFPLHSRWRLTNTIQSLRIVIQSFQI